MANYAQTKIVEEGPRNAIVRFTATLDSSDLNLVSAIKPLDFFNNDPRLTLIGFRVDNVQYSLGPTIGATLAWNGATPEQVLSMSLSEEIDASRYGGLQPDQTRDGYDGSLNIRTTGYPAGTVQNMTLLMKLVKLYR